VNIPPIGGRRFERYKVLPRALGESERSISRGQRHRFLSIILSFRPFQLRANAALQCVGEEKHAFAFPHNTVSHEMD